MIVTLIIFHSIKSQLSLIGLSEHLPYHFGITKYALLCMVRLAKITTRKSVSDGYAITFYDNIITVINITTHICILHLLHRHRKIQHTFHSYHHQCC